MKSSLQLTTSELTFRDKARAFRTPYPRQSEIRFVASNNCKFHDLVYQINSAERECEMIAYLGHLANASWASAANCASRDVCDVLIMFLCFSLNGEDPHQTFGDFARLNFQGAELSRSVLCNFPFHWTRRDIGDWKSVPPSDAHHHAITSHFQVPLSYFA